MSSSTLPEDILFSIFDVLSISNTPFLDKQTHQATLASLAQTCKQWNALTTPILYSSILVFSQSSLAMLYQTLRHSRKLREHVTSFFYFPQIVARPDDDLSSKERYYVTAVNRLCYRLQSEFLTRSQYKYIRRFGRHRRIQLFNSSTHPVVTGTLQVSHLTRLELQTNDYRLGDILLPSLFLPSLQELHLHRFRVFDVHDGFTSHEMEWPVMPSLERLRFTSCTFITGRPLPCHSPNLRALEVVGGIVFMLPRLFSAIEQFTPNVEFLSIIPMFHSSTSDALESNSGPGSGDMSNLPVLTKLQLSTGFFLSSKVSSFPRGVRELVLFEWEDSRVEDEAEMVKLQVDQLFFKTGDCWPPMKVTIHTPVPECYHDWAERFRIVKKGRGKGTEVIIRDTRPENVLRKRLNSVLSKFVSTRG